MRKDITRVKKPTSKKLNIVNFSRMEVCLLSLLLDRKAHSIDDLAEDVYKLAGKSKPMRARESITGMIRQTDAKLRSMGSRIHNLSGTGFGGRGNIGCYKMSGDIDEVKQIVERLIV